MAHIDLATLWIKRKDQKDSSPECILAWDGTSIEENWEGWEKAVDASIKSIGPELWQYRLFNIRVPEDVVEASFREWRNVDAEGISELDDPRSLS